MSKNKTRRIRVYIAGPLSADSISGRLHNVHRAIEACCELVQAGYAPFCPHLTYYVDNCDELGYGNWLEVDEAWVVVADAVLRLSGESQGADRECKLAIGMGIPVFYSIEAMQSGDPDIMSVYKTSKPKNGINDAPLKWNPALGDPRFHRLIDELLRLHIKKAQDYGTDGDPLANLRASAELGIPPWKASIVRLRDKFQRLAAYCTNGKLANEGVRDTLIDMAAYSLLTLILHDEEGAS